MNSDTEFVKVPIMFQGPKKRYKFLGCKPTVQKIGFHFLFAVHVFSGSPKTSSQIRKCFQNEGEQVFKIMFCNEVIGQLVNGFVQGYDLHDVAIFAISSDEFDRDVYIRVTVADKGRGKLSFYRHEQ